MARVSSMTNEGDAAAPRLAVFAPSPIVTVTVEESAGGGAEIHFHPGGQGFWVARMAASLGGSVVLCAATGGESGRVLRALIHDEGIELRSVSCRRPNGSYLHDRRGGEREEIASVPSPTLTRHEQDELFGVAVTAGLECGVMLLTGVEHDDVVPPDFYRRLAADLRRNGCRVLADLTGSTLDGALAGGLDVLKLSDRELVASRSLPSSGVSHLRPVAESLRDAGADSVVVTRAAEGALVVVDSRMLELRGPRFTALDPHGTGDSMFAALGLGFARGLALEDSLRLAGAAGALNATRHGLGSGSRAEVERLARSIELVEQDSGTFLP
jgi:1-phosphofructokinase